jgi:UDP-hydrolysing UDP-N-acetyl-D-glucosamine 2-epimerase
LVAYHPVTIARDTVREADALFEALGKVDAQLLFCFPNADAGSHNLQERTRAFLAKHTGGRIFTNLAPRTYWSLLAQVDLLLGNSSSGIMESASFALPTVNVGMRQQGRERAANVIDVAPDELAILRGIERARNPEFRAGLTGMENPYGNGNASEAIVSVLTTVPLSEQLLIKQATPVSSQPPTPAPANS